MECCLASFQNNCACSWATRVRRKCCSPEKQQRGAVPCGMAQEGGVDGSLRVAHDWDQQILPAGQQLMHNN